MRRLLPYLGTGVGAFALGYLVVLIFVFPVRGQPDEALVPNVLGLAFNEAATRLTAAGFRAQQGESRYNVGSPRSTVLSQTPLPAASVAKGTRIRLDISAGQRQGATPNVVGMSREQAQLALEKVGLEMGRVQEHESPLPRGEVLSMSPPAGTALILPSAISLVVSSGPMTVEVPYLVGRPLGEARSQLEQIGLAATTGGTRDSASAEPAGTVTRQTPAEGTPVAPGTAVNLTISAGSRAP
jgi:eukaryotic-like serine/threonine-protein kinase